jgi:hypothetical protein
MTAKPQRMTPPPLDDDDDIEVTRESVKAERAERAKAQRAAREPMTRRSWYTSTAAADAFSDVVEDLFHATRVPKHEVVAALLRAAVAQAPQIEKDLHAHDAPVRRVRRVAR